MLISNAANMVSGNLQTGLVHSLNRYFANQFVNILTVFPVFDIWEVWPSGEETAAHLAPGTLARNGREDIRAHPNIFRNNTPSSRKWHA